MPTKVQVRRDTLVNWSSKNPVLDFGEFGAVSGGSVAKLGDGTTHWNDLPSSMLPVASDAEAEAGVAEDRLVNAKQLKEFGGGEGVSAKELAVSIWTARKGAAVLNWRFILWSQELGTFVATTIINSGNKVMTSPDGIIWTLRPIPNDVSMVSVAWSPE